jgi:hypothetical protein
MSLSPGDYKVSIGLFTSGSKSVELGLSVNRRDSEAYYYIGDMTVTSNIPVTPVNLLKNPDFEENASTQSPNSWRTWSGNGSADADFTERKPYLGVYNASHWKKTRYNVYTYQTIYGLPNGSYRLSAWVRSGGGQISTSMDVKDFGSAKRSVAIPTTSNYTRVEISNILVSNGQCTVGFWSDAYAGQWMNFDNVEFFKE